MSNEREQFEAWYTEHYTSYIPKTGGGVYCNMDTLLAWKSWQESRKAALEEAAAYIENCSSLWSLANSIRTLKDRA